MYVGVPVISALAAMHGMVPPHPGPLTAIASLKTTVGPTMIYGFLAALPAMILGLSLIHISGRIDLYV